MVQALLVHELTSELYQIQAHCYRLLRAAIHLPAKTSCNSGIVLKPLEDKWEAQAQLYMCVCTSNLTDYRSLEDKWESNASTAVHLSLACMYQQLTDYRSILKARTNERPIQILLHRCHMCAHFLLFQVDKWFSARSLSGNPMDMLHERRKA